MQGRARRRRVKEVMMKLYFAPGACSLSPHIVMREVGANFDLEQVNNQEKKTKSGVDYWTINAKGQVPVLEFDNGERLTEGPVIVQWIADQNPWPDLPAHHARRLQGPLEGEPGQALRLARQAACRQAVPDGRQVHRRRRLPLHGAALDHAHRDRSGQVAEPQSLCGARRRSPEGAGGAQGRGADQITRRQTPSPG